MQTRTRRLAALAAVGALTFTMAACSSDDDATESTGTTAKTSDSMAGDDLSAMMAEVDLTSEGTITVCSDMPYEPFEFEDPDTGETTGFDFDVVSAMGDQLGVEVTFIDSEFEGILGLMAAGTCDMAASALTITPERQENADFTEPYFDADQSLLVLADNAETYTDLESLAGETIGVQADTTGETYANENKAEGTEVKSYAGADELFLALQSGEVAAVLQDLPVNNYRAVTDEAFVVTATFPTGEQYGFAVEKDDTAFLAALDAALASVKDDGSYDTIYETYFGAASS